MTTWIKSSHSGAQYGCVELRRQNGVVQIRDSKDVRSDAPILNLSPEAFEELLKAVKGAYSV